MVREVTVYFPLTFLDVTKFHFFLGKFWQQISDTGARRGPGSVFNDFFFFPGSGNRLEAR